MRDQTLLGPSVRRFLIAHRIEQALRASALALMILPIDLVRKDPAAFFKQPIGSGPYRLVSADFDNKLVYQAMGASFRSPRGVRHKNISSTRK